MAKEHLSEAAYIDMSEDELRNTLGYLHERLKRLKEAKSSDPKAEEMRAALKEHLKTITDETKTVTKRLKGARAVAKYRGIEWHMPKGDVE